MELNDFIKSTKDNISSFEKHWIKQNLKNCVDYPNTMNLVDWIEQFIMFCED